ncbi:hypothetical protein XHC_3183 [Xanthomonas hortorum pv. carotae str. M081]|nr:hypothetical protein XHC_3183 [Xanthomonas hortorum pv. carotae str. M081]
MQWPANCRVAEFSNDACMPGPGLHRRARRPIEKHRTRQARTTATASKDVRMQVRRISGVSQS